MGAINVYTHEGKIFNVKKILMDNPVEDDLNRMQITDEDASFNRALRDKIGTCGVSITYCNLHVGDEVNSVLDKWREQLDTKIKAVHDCQKEYYEAYILWSVAQNDGTPCLDLLTDMEEKLRELGIVTEELEEHAYSKPVYEVITKQPTDNSPGWEIAYNVDTLIQTGVCGNDKRSAEIYINSDLIELKNRLKNWFHGETYSIEIMDSYGETEDTVEVVSDLVHTKADFVKLLTDEQIL